MSTRSDYPELGRISNGFGCLILEDAEEQAGRALDEIARLRDELQRARDIAARYTRPTPTRTLLVKQLKGKK